MSFFLIGLAQCSPPDSGSGSPSSGDTGEAWDAIAARFLEEHFEANPPFAVQAGRHEFDGRLPDWTEAGLRAEIARLHAARDAAEDFDAESLDEARRLERENLLAAIDLNLFWIERAEAPWKNPDFYVGFWFLGAGLSPDVYLTRPYAPLPDRMRAYLRWARAVPAGVEQVRANLRTPLPRTYIDIGHTRYGGLATYLRNNVPAVFTEVEDDALQREFGEANAEAAAAFASLDEWLLAQRPEQTEDFALGAELFREMLWSTERVDVSLDELEAIGRRDLERNRRALEEACTAFAPGKSIAECFALMANNKPEGGAVEAARRQLEELEVFVRKKDLMDIPGTEKAQVEEAPPHQRGNFAYIDIPGPYEEGLPSVYYIAPPDPSWPAEEQRAYVPGMADLLFTSVHEAWPGHFLQFLHSNRVDSWIGRVFVGYASAEGWAHYTEELMWEAGLGEGDPEIQIGQLSNALLRNARFLSAIGLHARGMTVEESENLFRDAAFQDPGTARQQAARGTYDPAYLNYTMGKLMIKKLREDWTASRGGRDAWREFHNTFVSFGGPPIPLVREAMMGGRSGGLF
jgi:hypothetical protein